MAIKLIMKAYALLWPIIALIILSSSVDLSATISYKNSTEMNSNALTYDIFFDEIKYINGRIVTSSYNVTYRLLRLGDEFIDIPYFRYNILIPYMKRVLDVEISMQDLIILNSGKIYLNTGKIHTYTIGTNIKKYLSEPKEIDSYNFRNYYYNISYKMGFTIMTLEVSPLSLINRSLYRYNKCNIRITLGDSKPNPLYRGIISDHEEIRNIVINPEVLSTYPIANGLKNKSEIKYLIITKSQLLDPFISLKKHKESRYVSTRIETIENISSKYSGVDLPEKIRNCIKDYYLNHSTRFVLLAGDTFDTQGKEYVPHRGMYAEIDVGVLIYTNKFPCELYYGCLDGNWNSDRDNRWGEDGEEDWLAEVIVGRAPVNTLDEAWTFVNKTISFEKSSKPDKAFLHAENDPYVFGDMSVIKRNEGGYAARGVSYYLPASMIRDEMYEAKNYPTITVGAYSNKIVSSPLYVNHCGHGETTEYIIDGSDDTRFTRSNAMSLRNTFYPIHLSVACYAGAFDGGVYNPQSLQYGGDIEGGYTSDYDCLAEDFIKNPQGGMVACVLNSRFGLGYTNDPSRLSGELDNWFYAAVYHENIFNLGGAVQRARERYRPVGETYDDNYKAYKWVVFAFNLMGDPEMPLIADYTPPTVQIIAPANNTFHNKKDIEIEWYGNDIGSGIEKYELIVDFTEVIDVGKATTYKLYNISEGYHSITVAAYDKFGNSASATIYIWIDVTPPIVRIQEPQNSSIIPSGNVTVKWRGEDIVTYITHYEIRIDSGTYKNIGNVTSYTFKNLRDGKHKVYLKAVDRAKNFAIAIIEFTIDTTPPDIYITSPQNGTITNCTEIYISWRSSDYTSVEMFRVVEDSTTYYEGKENSCRIVLSEGKHNINILAIDAAGNVGVSTLSITIDTTPPKCWFLNVYDEYVHTDKNLNITWQAEDSVGIKTQKIYLDDKLIDEVDDMTFSYELKDLRDGTHTIKLVVEDLAGNKYSAVVSIIVDTLPGGKTLWMILELIILILVILAVLIALTFQRRKKRSSE